MSDGDEDRWRIDELAHRTGVSVDTIRFYQRDGLLPPARREGRSAMYGPAHLRRIEQIRDLQARHFNLGAVKALLADSRLGAIQAMFSSNEHTLTRAELIAAVGLEAGFVDQVEQAGLLVNPEQAGRTGYDRADVDVLDAVRQLLQMGMPDQVVLFMARLYAEHFADMQNEVAALFQGHGPVDWSDASRRAFIEDLGERVIDVFQLTARLLNYAHQATVRRMTLTTPLADDEGLPPPS
jgi:DNA-binding transcriptional MerR regulator